MINKFKENKNLRHFILYTISFMVLAILFAALGPFIPYISAKTGIVETEYSFLFSCRSFGMTLGCLVVKYFQKLSIRTHSILFLGCASIFIFSYLFSSASTSVWLGIWMFLGAIAYSFLEVALNVSIFLTQKVSEMSFWMQLANSLFGVGGIIGPYLVFLFEDNSYLSFGLISLTLLPFYYFLPSPETIKKTE